MDNLKAASFSMKISELQNRVLDLHEETEKQVHMLEILSKHLACLYEEVIDEENSRERSV